MIELHIDVKLYIKKLQVFFKEQPHQYKSLFGDADQYNIYKKILKFAIQNFKEFEDPTLTVDQFEFIAAEVRVKHTSVLNLLPPLCLN